MDMTRSQAENILNGYLLIFSNPNMEDAVQALREIILNAMTSYTSPITINPSTTVRPVTYTCESSTAK